MRILVATFLLIPILLTAACQPDPRREAAAYEQTVRADQYALDQEQARAHQIDLHQLELQTEQLKMQRRNAMQDELVNGQSLFIQVLFLTLSGCAIYLAMRTTHTTATIVKGMGEAAVMAAKLRANLIYLDAKTGSFPAVYIGKGKYTLTDINTGITRQLDTRSEPDAQMIRGAFAVRDRAITTSGAKEVQGNAEILFEVPKPTVLDYQEVDR